MVTFVQRQPIVYDIPCLKAPGGHCSNTHAWARSKSTAAGAPMNKLQPVPHIQAVSYRFGVFFSWAACIHLTYVACKFSNGCRGSSRHCANTLKLVMEVQRTWAGQFCFASESTARRGWCAIHRSSSMDQAVRAAVVERWLDVLHHLEELQSGACRCAVST